MLAPLDKTAYRKNVLLRQAKGDIPSPFAAFGLQPDDEFTDEELDQRARAVALLWKKEKQNPKLSGLVKLLEQRAPEFKAILHNPETREKERARERVAIATQDQDYERRREKVESQLSEIASERRGITPAEYSRLSRLLRDPPVFEQLLAKYGLQIEKEVSPYDPAQRQRIRDALRTYAGLSQGHASDAPPRRFPSLYVYLREFVSSLPTDGGSPSPDQVQLAVRLAKEAAAKLPHNPLRTTMDNLNGESEQLLDPGALASYDAGRSVDFREELDTILATFKPYDILDQTGFEELCAKGGPHGLADAETVKVVIRATQDAFIQIEGYQAGTPVRFVHCGACNEALLDRHQQECTNCGQPLYRLCPRCEAMQPTVAAVCGNCHLNLMARARAEALAEQASQLLAGRHPGAALDVARRAATEDKTLPGAAELVARAEQAVARSRALWDRAQKDLSARRLYSAAKCLDELAHLAPEEPAGDGTTIAHARERVRRGVEEGQRLLAAAEASCGASAERALVAALTAVADLKEARRRLASMPPSPPSAPVATPLAVGMHLQWTASPSPGELQYVVVRGSNEPPRARIDGTEIAVTQALACDDTEVEPGAVASWAVFAVRAEACSAPAVSAPVIVAPAVRDVCARAGDGRAELTWRPDLGSGSLRVERRTPEERPVTLAVQPASGRHRDLELRNGTTYTYVFSVTYPGLDGSPQAGPDVSVRTRPLPRPRAILGGRVEPTCTGVRFVAPPPAEGSAIVLRVTSLEGLPVQGSEIATEQVRPMGTEIPLNGTGWLDASPPTVAWYLPVTVLGDRAAIGAAVRHVQSPAVEELEITDCRSELHLSWSWPAGTSEAVVLVRDDAPPTGVNDPCARSLEVDRAMIAQGGCVVPVSEGGEVHVAVATVVRIAGERLYGTPAEQARRTLSRGGKRGEVHYRVTSTKRRRHRKLTVLAEGPAPLPDLVLVHHGSVVPLTRLSAERELGRFGGSQPTLELDNDAIPSRGYVRAFVASDVDTEQYRVVHPASSACCLS
ncbi:MAG: hypothetical protein ACLP01_25515 [Solirubrobacteraceae bacterium]